MRSFGKGLFIKDPILGAEPGGKRVFEIRSGDFIVSNVFAWEGAVGVAEPEHDGMIGSHRFMTWTPRGDVNVDYLRHYFGSETGVASLANASPGSAGRNRTLSIRNFERIVVPLPTRPEQDRIAAYLSRLAQRGHGRNEADRLIDRLVVREVAHARQAPIGLLLELQRRTVEIEAESVYREVGVRSFGKGLFVKEPVTGAELRGKRVFQIEEGDFIVSNVFGWEGAVGVAGPAHRGLIGSHRFMTWTPRGDLNVEYLRAYFRSKAGVASLATASTGSAGRNRTMSIANFEATEIPVPTRPEQDRIVAGIQVVDEITAVSKRADDLAAAILPAARNEIFSAMR